MAAETVLRVWCWLIEQLSTNWVQCEAKLPFTNTEFRGHYYCQRHKGHWGKHITSEGENFS